jgi:MFS family permease
LYALDNTVVANVQPKVVETFGHVSLVPWLGVSFALASAATTLIWSKAYGTFSAKKLYIGSTVVFMGASALCGGAPDINSFIVGRAIAGAGGCGMYMGLLTLMSVTTDNIERPKYLSLTGFIWGVGTVLGPVVGGALGDSKATWRWAFYLNLLVGAVVAPIYILLLPDFRPQKDVPILKRFGQIDYIGALLSIGTLLCAIMAMNFGGVLWTWSSSNSIGLFVGAGVLLVLFVVQQTFNLGTNFQNRMFPMHFWKSRTLIVLFLTMSEYSQHLLHKHGVKSNYVQCWRLSAASLASTTCPSTTNSPAEAQPLKPPSISCPSFCCWSPSTWSTVSLWARPATTTPGTFSALLSS